MRKRLENTKQYCVNSYLLDMYPEGNLKQKTRIYQDIVELTKTYSHYDSNKSSTIAYPSGETEYSEHHKSFITTQSQSMVRYRGQIYPNNWTYLEKVNFFYYDSNIQIEFGHHKLRKNGRILTYNADRNYTSPTVDFHKTSQFVQGITLHFCFVNLYSRIRYLANRNKREQIMSLIKKNEIILYDDKISKKFNIHIR